MITAHREMKALRVWVLATFDFAHSPPVDAGWIAVLLVASYDAAFASDALVHVEVKAILLTDER